MFDVITVFARTCNAVMHINCRQICQNWNLNANWTYKSMRCTRVFKNIFIICKFRTTCFQSCSKFSFINIQITTNQNTKISFFERKRIENIC